MEIERQEVFQSLARFRKGLLQIMIFFILSGIPIFLFSKPILRHLQDTSLKIDLVAFAIPESFIAVLKLTLYASLFLSMPLILFHLWKAFAPLFQKRGLKSSKAFPRRKRTTCLSFCRSSPRGSANPRGRIRLSERGSFTRCSR